MTVRSFGFTAITAIGLLSLGGCVGYNVYPPVEGYNAISSANMTLVTAPETAALAWAVPRYPPEGERFQGEGLLADRATDPPPLAINLPEGTSRTSYLRVASGVRQGAQPLSRENAGLPTYHIVRVWVRGDEAKVDMLVPIVARADDGAIRTTRHQGVTAELRGGVRPWHVVAHREWSLGMFEVPRPNYMGESAAAPEAAPAPGEAPEQPAESPEPQ